MKHTSLHHKLPLLVVLLGLSMTLYLSACGGDLNSPPDGAGGATQETGATLDSHEQTTSPEKIVEFSPVETTADESAP